MSNPRLLDKIKNPDVPGLEDSLSAPPPPPIISNNYPENTQNPTISTNLVTYPHIPIGNYYPTPTPTPTPVATNQQWWVPNETDSEVYNKWYETAYKAALQASSDKDVTGKLKTKYYKRKLEVIDPKADAERVANAQKELSALMKPLKCDLCNAVMNSTLQAKLHYQGKPHQKKVSMYLNQSAKKIKTEDGHVSSTTSDWNTYCEICKIWFTSQTDATQHYAGKKHAKAAFGTTKSKPKKPTINKSPIDPTGRYGIGLAFQKSEITTPESPATPENLPPVIPATPQYNTPTLTYPTTLQCDLCGISVNRIDQLETHKRGTRHLKMLKLHGMPTSDTESTPLHSGPIDYSIYRTPSGQYYCSPCNLSLNSEIRFAQHMESKKHKNQVNPKLQNSPPASKKPKKK